MEFVNPSFLFGLFALTIPVIIHLFNFRRFRKVYFTNVAFIRDLKQETKKQSRLKHWLVLLARMLAITAVVFAFARPYFPAKDAQLKLEDQQSISVYIDNSFSMQAESEAGTLLQIAVAKAREIASVFKNTDRFNVLTNDFEGRHQRFVSRDEFYDLISEIDYSPAVKNLRQVLVRQDALLQQESSGNRSSFILSDFQKHFTEAVKEPGDSLPRTFLLPLSGTDVDNLTIDSCWFNAPVQQINQSGKLFVRVRNLSGNEYSDIPVRLTVNDRQRAVASLSLAANETKVVELNYTHTEPGIQTGVLELNDHPITFDDAFYFTYQTMSEVKVLGINQDEPNVYLNTLFGRDTVVRFTNREIIRLDFSSLRDFDLLILNHLTDISSGLRQELSRFLEAGGSIVVFPSQTPELDAYNAFLRNVSAGSMLPMDSTNQRVQTLNAEHPLFAGVFDEIPENIDLPEVRGYFVVRPSNQTRFESLLTLQNNALFFVAFPTGKGTLYLSSVPLDPAYSSFPRHPVFVPILYKIAVSSVVQDDLYSILGQDELIRTDALGREQSDEVLKIRNASKTFEVIPEQRQIGFEMELNVHTQIVQAGNYFLSYQDEPVRGLAFNYDRKESEMTFYSSDELKSQILDGQFTEISVLENTSEPFSATLREMGYGKQLWQLFILLGLLFLLSEILLLRFIK
jgi:hypothetical protein